LLAGTRLVIKSGMTVSDVIAFPLPRLLCDVGGTHIRFAAVEAESTPPRFLSHTALADHPDFIAAARGAVAAMPAPPASLVICAAGPADGCSVTLTNRDWRIDGHEIVGALRLKQGLLLNDFEAVALSLPALDARSFVPAIEREEVSTLDGLQLVVGAGTGLGVAALISNGGLYQSISSEAGHVTLAPATEEDEAVFAHIERSNGRLTAETIISGPGLERLHSARLAVAAHTNSAKKTAAEISIEAQQNPAGFEADTVRHFWRIVARFAGDMALVFTARKGVVLAGGVLQKLFPLLEAKEFRACFQDKSPMQKLICGMSVHLLQDEYAVLSGLARIASRPAEYSIDFQTRRWR